MERMNPPPPISIDVGKVPVLFMGLSSLPSPFRHRPPVCLLGFFASSPPARASITQRIAYVCGNVSSAKGRG